MSVKLAHSDSKYQQKSVKCIWPLQAKPCFNWLVVSGVSSHLVFVQCMTWLTALLCLHVTGPLKVESLFFCVYPNVPSLSVFHVNVEIPSITEILSGLCKFSVKSGMFPALLCPFVVRFAWFSLHAAAEPHSSSPPNHLIWLALQKCMWWLTIDTSILSWLSHMMALAGLASKLKMKSSKKFSKDQALQN